MSAPQVRVDTPMQGAWQQAMGGGLAARAASAVPRAAEHEEGAGDAPRAWWRTALRVARDVAIGFALVAAIPLVSIGVFGPADWSTNSTRDRVVETERLRAFALEQRASITPLEAGSALYRVAPPKADPMISMRPVVPDVLPWSGFAPAAGLFGDHRSARWPGPEPTKVIERAAQGYSAEEIAWLKHIADAPLWRDVELVARAPQIDIDGARLAKPLDPAAPWLYPLRTSTQRFRQIADAGVARAAYYVSQRDYAKADDALRAVVSLGFALVDNGTTFLDALTGRVVIDIGRNGLHQLSAVDGRRDVYARTVPFRTNADAQRLPIKTRESDAGALLADASLARSFRFEQYGLLSYSACGSVKKVLLGLSAAEQAAMADARRTLPRFESERTMLELQGRRMDAIGQIAPPLNAVTSIIVGAGEVTSAVTGNPRIATCSRFVAARLQGR